MDVVSNEERENDRPMPNEFDLFLPWACQQLQVNATVTIVKVIRADYLSGVQTERPKAKGKINTQADTESIEIDKTSDSDMIDEINHDTIVTVHTSYDSHNNLIEIKFEKNKHVPRVILKIIGLILPFHTHLNAVTLNKGLDKFVIYELQKWLAVSNITEVCLDNTYFAEASYDILLEPQCKLRQLSLARCGINDKVCQNIASKLVYPGSCFLSVLNLSSNRITNLGAKYLGDALRSNRKLYYLNLAGNIIGDDGARSILNTLQEFPLISEEILEARSRNLDYLKKRNELIDRLSKELRADDSDKKQSRAKSSKSTTLKKGKGQSLINMETTKVQAIADNILGHFDDPFNDNNTEVRDSIVYCTGNNSLCYLNMAFNNLCYLTVKLLLNVLVEQKHMDRTPRGLLNVVIEGNCVPKCCMELIMIDQIIENALTSLDPKMIGKKKDKKKTKINSSE